MQTRMAELEQQQGALQAKVDALEAEQIAIATDGDSAAIERRQARALTDDLAGRVAKLEENDAPRPTAAPRPGRPDPSARYAATIGNAHTRGSASALVTVVMWGDFQCPFSSRVMPTIEALEKKYGSDMRFVFKHNPLPFHHEARPAAKAAEAAGRQGKFWEMHALLFDNAKDLNKDKYGKLAKKLRLDRKQFARDMKSDAIESEVGAQQAQSVLLGARGTPAFFVNGRFLSGAQPQHKFEELIDEELAHAKRMVDRGTRPRDVYDELMKTARPKV